MDQKKIGSFLRELRKEKELTQEQLAERFNVSNRTISRWETGSNMPDLSLLVELADYYDVDIQEIIHGERKSEKMSQEEKEKMLLVADYTEKEKDVLLKRLRIISIIGLCAFLIGFTMLSMGLSGTSPVADYILGTSFGLTVGALLTSILYSTGVLSSIRKNKEKSRYMLIIGVIFGVVCAVLFIISSVISFAFVA